MIKASRIKAIHGGGTSVLEPEPQTAEQFQTVDPADRPVASAPADWIDLYKWVQKRAERGAPFIKSAKNAKKKQYPGNKEGMANWICGMFGLLSEYHNYPSPPPTYFGMKVPEIGPENCAVNLAQQSFIILVNPKALLEIYEKVRELGGYKGEDYTGFWDDVKKDIRACPSENPDELKCQIGLYPDDVVAVQNRVMQIFAKTDEAHYTPRVAGGAPKGSGKTPKKDDPKL